MGELGDWANKNSKFIVLDDGETITATYRGFKIGVNRFDVDKEIVSYNLELLIGGQAVTKSFQSGSGKAARFFDGIDEGQRVQITRHGTGTGTEYDYDLITDPPV